ncbi:hypothetical protein AAEU29_01600 [Pseudoalteromonas sp. SSM20]|uniref:hypothetical protein n=1 Tax=Pseudoalteromonas sp. SSM20 TaxID=3139394 RepID=UPI003BAC8C06
MPSNRLLFALLFSFVLTGCGGGGSLESPNNGGGENPGSGTDGVITLEITVSDESGNPLTESNPITQSNQGIVTVTVKNDGNAVTEGIVAFSTEYTGKILSETGTQILDADGVATVKLSSGDFKGAGAVTALLSGTEISKSAYFFSSGDDASVETAQTLIDIKLLTDCNDGWESNRDLVKLDPLEPSTGCTVLSRDISSNQIGTVFVSVANASSGDGFKDILIDASSTVGKLLPESGKQVTDNYGIALLTFEPGTKNEAGEITVSARDVSKTKAISVGVAEFTLAIDNGLNLKTDNSGEYVPLAAGATTVITVDIIDTDGTPLTVPLDVEFSSACSQNGGAKIDALSTSIGGKASATYLSQGCNGNGSDIITAFVNGKSISTSLPLSSSQVASIEFIDSTQSVIALKGTGGKGRSESSNISFKLKDELGKPVANSRLDFKLNSYNGGVSLNRSSINTDSDGISQVTITAGKVPMSVRVYACYIPDSEIPDTYPVDDVTCWKERYDTCKTNSNAEDCPTGNLSFVDLDAQIMTVSDLLTITSGLPDNDSFSLAAETLSVEALSHDGEVSDLTISMADHFGNFVPDGTAVYLRTEGGAVGLIDSEQYTDLLRCETVDGQCTVQWKSQDPRPFTDGKWGNSISAINPKTGNVNCDPWFGSPAPCLNGIVNANSNVNGVPLGARATILATTAGEENYIDRNANGMFDSGEFYSSYDLPEAFVDNNENGQFDGNVDCSTGVNCIPTNTDGGEFEEFVDLNGDGEYTAANGKFNGLVCSEQAEANGDCSKSLVDLRRNIEIVMSGSTAFGRYTIHKSHYVPSFHGTNGSIPANCSDVILEKSADDTWEFENGQDNKFVLLELEESENQDYCDIKSADISRIYIHIDDDNNSSTPANCDREGAVYENGACTSELDQAIDVGLTSVSFQFYYSDIYNNPLPAGTTVEYSSSNGDTDAGSYVLANSTATVAAGRGHSVSREGTPNKRTSGEFIYKFLTPKGTLSDVPLIIRDEG